MPVTARLTADIPPEHQAMGRKQQAELYEGGVHYQQRQLGDGSYTGVDLSLYSEPLFDPNETSFADPAVSNAVNYVTTSMPVQKAIYSQPQVSPPAIAVPRGATGIVIDKNMLQYTLGDKLYVSHLPEASPLSAQPHASQAYASSVSTVVSSTPVMQTPAEVASIPVPVTRSPGVTGQVSTQCAAAVERAERPNTIPGLMPPPPPPPPPQTQTHTASGQEQSTGPTVSAVSTGPASTSTASTSFAG